jgi:hypothetical protein
MGDEGPSNGVGGHQLSQVHVTHMLTAAHALFLCVPTAAAPLIVVQVAPTKVPWSCLDKLLPSWLS